MATITYKRRVLSVAGKVQVKRHTEKAKKKYDMCPEFGLVNAKIDTI